MVRSTTLRIKNVSNPNNTDPFIGQILDARYRIEELIARGGMATVYRAIDLRLGRVVALKILAGTLAADPDFVERFIQEARSTAALTHPNVVAVHDQGVWNEFPFLIMEFVPGRTIREVLIKNGPFTSAHALEIIQAVLLGLSAAHDAGFVHRDIKPENVLITDEGHVKVTDFGLARLISATPASSSTGAVLLGTMAYLSPEQVQQQNIDQRSDVYSAGILLFEMLTGRVPFTADTPLAVAYRHVHEDVPPPSSLQPDVPPAVDHVVLAATRRVPSERLQSARSFHEAIARAMSGVPVAEALTTALPVNQTIILDRGEIPQTKTQVVDTPTESKKRKSIRGRALFAGFFLIMAIFASSWLIFDGNRVIVPAVAGKPELSATNSLKEVGLNSRITLRYSESIEIGTTISTNPKFGQKVRKGQEVDIYVSKGKERYVLPSELVGMDPNVASDLLTSLTLVTSKTQSIYSNKIPIGKVVRTNPAIGSQVKRATDITLLISRGPAPVPVPGIAGVSVAVATKMLGKLGLSLDVVDQIFDDSKEGTIISSDPVPGSSVPKGSEVKVTVSKGPSLIDVPNVVGMGTDEAIALLKAAGFKVITNNRLGIAVLNTVYSQSPSGNNQAPRSSTITLEIV